MPEEIFDFIARHRQALENSLAAHLPVSASPGTRRLNEALDYSIFPGGKRMRPVLTLLGAVIVGGTTAQALPAACAIEFLHTSSLILDDLPAMDDADLRRGRAATHLIFGEAIAILAALALLNKSYALLVQAARQTGADSIAGALVSEATRLIGADGMIGGQAADLELHVVSVGADALASRSLKTTALMRLTMSAGALVCGASELDANALAQFGESLGTAYQIGDDLLDELDDSRLTGKNSRQDRRHLRPSYVAELGVEGAQRMALSLVDQGKSAIREQFGNRPEARLLIEAADLIMGRLGRMENVGRGA